MTQIDVSKHSKICILFKHRKLGKCQQETAERVKVQSPVGRRKKWIRELIHFFVVGINLLVQFDFLKPVHLFIDENKTIFKPNTQAFLLFSSFLFYFSSSFWEIS